MLIFERKITVGGASALFLFVETTGWWTGKRGGNGRGDVQEHRFCVRIRVWMR